MVMTFLCKFIAIICNLKNFTHRLLGWLYLLRWLIGVNRHKNLRTYFGSFHHISNAKRTFLLDITHLMYYYYYYSSEWRKFRFLQSAQNYLYFSLTSTSMEISRMIQSKVIMYCIPSCSDSSKRNEQLQINERYTICRRIHCVQMSNDYEYFRFQSIP